MCRTSQGCAGAVMSFRATLRAIPELRVSRNVRVELLEGVP